MYVRFFLLLQPHMVLGSSKGPPILKYHKVLEGFKKNQKYIVQYLFYVFVFYIFVGIFFTFSY